MPTEVDDSKRLHLGGTKHLDAPGPFNELPDFIFQPFASDSECEVVYALSQHEFWASEGEGHPLASSQAANGRRLKVVARSVQPAAERVLDLHAHDQPGYI